MKIEKISYTIFLENSVFEIFAITLYDMKLIELYKYHRHNKIF